MKQEEKNRKSREHILACAFAEFAAQGYAGASVNAICVRGSISKGLLYHYYADRDALYLACVERCFDDLTAALSAVLNAQTVTPEQYFDARLRYFSEHPQHQRLYCQVHGLPPTSLRCCRADKTPAHRFPKKFANNPLRSYPSLLQ